MIQSTVTTRTRKQLRNCMYKYSAPISFHFISFFFEEAHSLIISNGNMKYEIFINYIIYFLLHIDEKKLLASESRGE